ncbi:uncharacterized protein LOC131432518 isoform X3 [Malaya genurostris]|uniref:uncharacterized protein LOC131432518 isoform X3 n=1 Tax=Malaya genurostris TaxID=325434 RepID=UPI0026F39DB1|nr:uncharacterized protein LOC131432518 isoform X3 [Malaya genurostris]
MLLVSQKKNWMFSTHGVPLSSYAYGVLMNLPDVFSFAAGISNLVVKRQRVFQAGYLLIIALDECRTAHNENRCKNYFGYISGHKIERSVSDELENFQIWNHFVGVFSGT